MSKKLREADLYHAARDWLRSQGYAVHIEIFDADLIGLKDGRMCVIELKLCNSEKLMKQLYDRARWADECWGVIATETKAIWEYKRNGFGLMQWKDGKLKTIVKGRQQPYRWHKLRPYRLKRLSKAMPAPDHHLAGLPPKQRCIHNTTVAPDRSISVAV